MNSAEHGRGDVCSPSFCIYVRCATREDALLWRLLQSDLDKTNRLPVGACTSPSVSKYKDYFDINMAVCVCCLFFLRLLFASASFFSSHD